MSIFIYVGALPEQNKPEGPVQGILRKILCRNVGKFLMVIE